MTPLPPPVRSPLDELGLNLTRRRFFEQGGHLLGGAALASLLPGLGVRGEDAGFAKIAGAVGPHFAPRAKHVIYLHMVGGPPQRTCSTTSRKWTSGTTRICLTASARASG